MTLTSNISIKWYLRKIILIITYLVLLGLREPYFKKIDTKAKEK